MRIYIKQLDGKVKPFECTAGTTIQTLRQQAAEQFSKDLAAITLVAGGVVLQDAQTLQDANVQKDQILYLVYRLPGGY